MGETDGRTDGRMPDRYITLTATRGQHNSDQRETAMRHTSKKQIIFASTQ